MEELVALVNKRDEMIETIELERQRVEKESESNNNSLPLNTQSPAKGTLGRFFLTGKLPGFSRLGPGITKRFFASYSW